VQIEGPAEHGGCGGSSESWAVEGRDKWGTPLGCIIVPNAACCKAASLRSGVFFRGLFEINAGLLLTTFGSLNITAQPK
jgi:hypothetical protein